MTYGYARVSTTDQHLEVQRVQLQQAGCDIIYEETASGVDDNRLALASMLYVLNSGDTVVVCKLDRIARSTRHLLDIVDDLNRKGVTFKVLNVNLDTGTATGKLMITMLAAVATFEVEMLHERQKEGIARAKLAGKYKGGVKHASKKA